MNGPTEQKVALDDKLRAEGFHYIKWVEKADLSDTLTEILKYDPRANRIEQILLIHQDAEFSTDAVTGEKTRAVAGERPVWQDNNPVYFIYMKYNE